MGLHEIVNGKSERLYEGFCSGDYPIEIQELMFRDYKTLQQNAWVPRHMTIVILGKTV